MTGKPIALFINNLAKVGGQGYLQCMFLEIAYQSNQC